MTYEEAGALAQSRKRKIGNNTVLGTHGAPESYAVQLHGTDVVTLRRDGAVILNSGGWRTVTTKARMNEHAPNGWGVNQERGAWYVSRYLGDGGWSERVPYVDGIVLYPDGRVETP